MIYNQPSIIRNTKQEARNELNRIRDTKGKTAKNCFLTENEYINKLVKTMPQHYGSKKRPYEFELNFGQDLPIASLYVGIDSFVIEWYITVIDDQRYRPSIITIYGIEVDDYIKAFKKNYEIYEAMDRSIYTEHKAENGMTIHSNGEYAGVCMDYNEFKIDSREKLSRMINGLEKAKKIYEQSVIDLNDKLLVRTNNKFEEMCLEYAKNYTHYFARSRDEVIEELRRKGFTEENIKYAMDNLNINWNDQAVHYIKDYTHYFVRSREDVIEELKRKGFTKENIEYAMDKFYRQYNYRINIERYALISNNEVEADNATLGEKNAYKSAKEHLSTSSFSKKRLVERLEWEGYIESEIAYALQKVGY